MLISTSLVADQIHITRREDGVLAGQRYERWKIEVKSPDGSRYDILISGESGKNGGDPPSMMTLNNRIKVTNNYPTIAAIPDTGRVLGVWENGVMVQQSPYGNMMRVYLSGLTDDPVASYSLNSETGWRFVDRMRYAYLAGLNRSPFSCRQEGSSGDLNMKCTVCEEKLTESHSTVFAMEDGTNGEWHTLILRTPMLCRRCNTTWCVKAERVLRELFDDMKSKLSQDTSGDAQT